MKSQNKLTVSYLKSCALVLFGALSLSTVAKAEVPLTLSDLTAKVKSQNLLLKENLIITHQAQRTVQMNRLSLLPRLNLHNIVAMGGANLMSMGSIIDDIAPFLIPANWFRVSEAEVSQEFQKQSFKALWGNEVLDARFLYMTIVSDMRAQDIYQKYQEDLKELQDIAETRDEFGGDRLDSLEMLLAQKARVTEDQVHLKDLINQEVYNLTQMAQIDPRIEYKIDKTTRVTSSWIFLEKDKFITLAQQLSPEIESYNQLLIFLSKLKNEIIFSIFGSSDLSQGVAGGVFNDLPANSGWGFSTKTAFALNKGKEDQLKNQKLGTQETLKRQVLRLYDQLRFLGEKEQALLDRQKHLDKQWQILQDRLQFGKNAAMDELIGNRQNFAETQIALVNINTIRFQLNERAHRILWWDVYKDFSAPL